MKVKLSGNSALIKLSKKEELIKWEDVPTGIDNLEIIAAEACILDQLPPFMQSLKSLTINSKNLIHNEKLALTPFNYLKVTNSQIETLPILNFRLMKKCFFQRNKLKDITNLNLDYCSELEELDFGQNQITELPDCFKNFQKLKRINLENNSIKNLPNSIYELPSITHLALKGNPLTEDSKQRLYDSFKIIID